MVECVELSVVICIHYNGDAFFGVCKYGSFRFCHGLNLCTIC